MCEARARATLPHWPRRADLPRRRDAGDQHTTAPRNRSPPPLSPLPRSNNGRRDHPGRQGCAAPPSVITTSCRAGCARDSRPTGHTAARSVVHANAVYLRPFARQTKARRSCCPYCYSCADGCIRFRVLCDRYITVRGCRGAAGEQASRARRESLWDEQSYQAPLVCVLVMAIAYTARMWATADDGRIL